YNRMKRADKRTDYVMVKARTNSEWDNVDFVLFHVTDGWLQTLRTRLEMLQPFTEDMDFWEHAYFGSPEGYYTSPDDWNAEELLSESEAWAFVEATAEELEQLPTPESRLDTDQLTLDRYGNLQFKAYGKYTGEEFYTEGFNAMDFLYRCGDNTGKIQ